jgi:type I restriction enzyme, S subunit
MPDEVLTIKQVTTNGRPYRRTTRLPLDILAKAFRGELVPREPRDEPASELLARARGARGGACEAAKPKRRKSASP